MLGLRGASLDQVIKIGDLQNNPQLAGFSKLKIKDFSQNIGTDIGGVPLKDIELLNGVNLQQLNKLYKLDNIKVKDALPAVQLFVSAVFDPQGSLKQVRKNALSTGAKVLVKKLQKNSALKDVPFERILAGDWRGSILEGEKVLLKEVGDKIPDHLRRLPIGSLTVDIIEQDFTSLQNTAINYGVNELQELTLNELLTEFPEIQDVPLSVVSSLANQPLSQSLPKLADYTIEELGVQDKLLSSIPGLGDSPVSAVLGDLIFSILAGDVFAKMDIAYSGQDGSEFHNGRPLSGGTRNQKFKPEPGIRSPTSKTKSTKGMPRIEVKPAEGGSTVLGGTPLLGKEWMTRDQKVPGCKGILCTFGKWEPAGIKPVSSSWVKFSIGDLKEYDDKAFTARVYVDTQVCINILFTTHCTAHLVSVPTPWKLTRNSLFPVLSKRRVQDLFPGINEQGQISNFCTNGNFGNQPTASSSPPQGNKYGHLAYAETSGDLAQVTSVDGVTNTLAPDAAQAFENMVAAAQAQGLDIQAVSGFRSVDLQRQLWDAKVAKVGSAQEAAKTSAPPGYSEHHTGYAVDVGNAQNPYLNTDWAQTREYAWMQANAGQFGFELSFPQGNSQGVSFEPWHWRYTGSSAAKQAFANVNSSTAQQSGSAPNLASQPSGSTLAPNLTALKNVPGISNTSQSSGSTLAPNLTGLKNVPGISNTSQQAGSAPKKNDPQRNIRQYLARIALGESSGGTDLGPHPDTGAYGEYQFIPETRRAILNRYGVDAWSTNKAERDQATLALIRDFSGQVGTDIMGLIEAGNFAAADVLLGRPVPGKTKFGQFTSLPGGAEASKYWNDPATLAQYGPSGDAGTNAPLLASNSINCNPALLASAGATGIIQPEGNGIATGKFENPNPGYPVTSRYGNRSLGWHSGIDLGIPVGTPVNASDGGIVEEIGFQAGGYGNYVIVNHKNGYSTLYAHLSEAQVKVNQKVTKGAPIALSGNTGRSTGPHLHFEIIRTVNGVTPRKGNAINPDFLVNFN
ncbi:D-alanyl-D-alanine carboxypeptidase family protein (plasmid) [Acaryochloris sp. 'Moss Beach']|uniref:D-alanyl-D-alanine carboxypeptidase family protein n=1 Tax=Acaryochloris sp. 'Moss Beach' TaxID=2740837 RepID=UPI001F195D75|nr:D-alanyl-D-alanine carboxypeptidase family protein [Acaryochloris sp. 'Moss Beach']UJB73382.1 D-alanyl-D-alanine carboxypeptidase family protein [Acaryochloris sp. 'Moss Beach']